MVAQRDRLGDLQVGEAGHHRRGVLVGAIDQGAGQRLDPRQRLVDRVAHPQAEVGGDLVVARPRGVEASGVGTDLLGQRGLDRHVDVLERQVDGHAVPLPARLDRLQPGRDPLRRVALHDALFGQHRDMRPAAGQVLPPQPPVERDRRVDLPHHRRRPLGEAAAPQRVGGGRLGHGPAARRAGRASQGSGTPRPLPHRGKVQKDRLLLRHPGEGGIPMCADPTTPLSLSLSKAGWAQGPRSPEAGTWSDPPSTSSG